MAAQVSAIASAFLTIDTELQSRVGICTPNTPEHFATRLMVLAYDEIWVQINPKSTRPEFRDVIDAFLD